MELLYYSGSGFELDAKLFHRFILPFNSVPQGILYFSWCWVRVMVRKGVVLGGTWRYVWAFVQFYYPGEALRPFLLMCM